MTFRFAPAQFRRPDIRTFPSVEGWGSTIHTFEPLRWRCENYLPGNGTDQRGSVVR